MTAPEITSSRTYMNISRILWVLFAACLMSFGFLIDGTSEVGHHAALIVGGALAGWKLKR